jgi:photosystem II stability/assembly factor-like uncharacterized protein
MITLRMLVIAALAALFSFTTLTRLDAQTTSWTRLDPLYPPGTAFFAVTSAGDTFYLTGCDRIVVKLVDLSTPNPRFDRYDGACFYDATTSPAGQVWAVGGQGAIGRDLVRSPVSGVLGDSQFDLTGVAFASADTGLIVGSHRTRSYGQMYRTTNRGATWQTIALPVTAELWSVAMRRGIALATGGDGTILRSADAGATWRVVAGDPAAGLGNIASVQFVDDDTVLATGDARKADTVGVILRSTDAGITWSRPTYDPVVPRLGIGGIAFTSRSHGLIVGYRNVLLETTDAGATWTRRALPPGRLVTHDLHFADSIRGVAVGYDGLITTTTDGGATWAVRSAVAGGYELNDVALDTKGRVAAVGNAPFIVVSDTAQRSLRRQVTGTSSALTSVAWTPAGTILAVSAAGELVSCAVDGAPTVTIPAGSNVRFERIRMSRNGVGWIIGSSAGSNIALKSTDAGATWGTVAIPSSPALRRLHLVDDATLWIVGDSGLVVRSTDAGANWRVTWAGTTHRLRGVHAVNAEDAVVVGTGLLLRTTDGGGSWSAPFPVSSSLRDIACADSAHCVAVGTLGNTIATADRFLSRASDRAPIRDSLTAVAVAGARAVAVSGAGELVVTDFTGVTTLVEPGPTRVDEMMRIERRGGQLELTVLGDAVTIAFVHVIDALGRTVLAGSGGHRTGETILLDRPGTSGPYFVIVTLGDGRIVSGRVVVW